jgi:hypothetical protein
MNCAADKCAQGRKPCPTPSACDDDTGHQLANWRELQGPVIAVTILFIFAAGMGIGAWLERMP